MPDLKPVGVQLIAENGEQYVATLNQAATAEKQLTESLQPLAMGATQVAQATAGEVSSLQLAIDSMLKQGVTVEQVRAFYAQYGGNMSEVNAILKQHTAALEEDTGATQANTEVTAANSEAHKMLGGNIGTTSGILREGRLLMVAMTAEMALMTLAAGDTLPPAMREAAKGIQEVVMFAMMGFIAGGPFVAALAAIAGAAIVVGTMAMQASEGEQELNKQLDTLAKKEEVASTLATIMGWTEAEAEAALKAAKNNMDLAQSLDAVTKARERQISLEKEAQAPGADLRSRMLAQQQLPSADEAVRLAQATYDAQKAADAATSSYAKLTTTLQTDAEKTATGQLSELGDVSQDTAKKFLTFASSNQDVATQASALTTNIVSAQASLAAYRAEGGSSQQAIDGLNKYIEEQKNKLADLINNTNSQADAYKALRTAIDNLNASGNTANSELAGLLDLTPKQAGQVMTLAQNDATLAKVMADSIPVIIMYNESLKSGAPDVGGEKALAASIAVDKFKSALLDAFNTANTNKIDFNYDNTNATRAIEDAQRIANAWRTMSEDMARAQQTATEGIAKAQQTMDDSIAKAQQSLNETLAKDAQALADKLADIQQQLADKQANAAYTLQKNLESLSDERVKDQQDLATKLADIERKRIEDIANLDFDTGLKLRKAKTDHDREEIMLESEHQRQVINQRADDEKSTAHRTFDDQMQQLAERRKNYEEEYQHELQVAERTAAEETARAKREYAQQVADAKQRYADEVAATRLRDQEELASIVQRLKDEQERIKQRYNDEILNIQNATAVALAASAARVSSFENEYAWLQALTQQAVAYNQALAGYGQPGYQSVEQRYGAGYQMGGDFVADRPQLIMVGEGYQRERVSITPLQGSSTSNDNRRSIGQVTFQISGVNDPNAIWRFIEGKFADEAVYG